jgi:predicted ATPase
MVDFPQANSLDRVRATVDAVASGKKDPASIGAAVGLSSRHTHYHLSAARALGWLSSQEARWQLTSRGRQLVKLSPGSSAEAHFFHESIRTSAFAEELGIDLLSKHEPNREQLVKRLQAAGGLSVNTAQRRAQTLFAWRRRLFQGSLFGWEPIPNTQETLVEDTSTKPLRPLLTSLRLERFKNFREATLQIGHLTLLVGTNASGKSNIRDAFRFLHGISRGYNLAEIIGEKWIEGGVLQWKGIRGGTKEVTFGKEKTFAIEAGFRIRDGDRERNATYRIEVDVSHSSGPRVVLERFVITGRGQFVFDSHPEKNAPSQDDPLHLNVRLRKPYQAGFVGPAVAIISNQPAITQLFENPEIGIDIRAHIRFALAAFRSMRFLDLSPDAMRIPSLPGQTVLGDRGENLSSVLMGICSDRKRKKGLLEWIRELTPMDAKDFKFPADATGRVLLKLVEEGGTETSAYSASDGTLRFLAMIAAFLGTEPAHLYFFEELENGIHPTRLHLLLQLIEQQTSKQLSQVIATTHSPQLLAYLNPDSLKSATLVHRRPHRPEASIMRVLEIPHVARVLKKRDLARLHATGWLENALELSADEDAA